MLPGVVVDVVGLAVVELVAARVELVEVGAVILGGSVRLKLIQGTGQEAHPHVSTVSFKIGASCSEGGFMTTNENVYNFPATVGQGGERTRDPFL
jgi:hypothetical protein